MKKIKCVKYPAVTAASADSNPAKCHVSQMSFDILFRDDEAYDLSDVENALVSAGYNVIGSDSTDITDAYRQEDLEDLM